LQAFLQEVAFSVSTMVGLDVTITDDSLVRLAGTGEYQNRIGEQLPASCSFGKVIRTGTPCLVTRPREDPECSECDKRDQCRETCHIAFPLIVDHRPIGVLSLLSFTDKQRDQIIQRRDEYSRFVDHMARLIAMAAHHEETAQKLAEARDRLTGIVDAVREGIIAVDEEGKIISCNEAAARILRFGDKEAVIGKPLADLVPGAPMLEVLQTGVGYVNREVILPTPGGTLHHITTTAPLFSRGRIAGAVALLKNLDDVRHIAYEFAERQPEKPIEHILGRDPQLQRAKQMALQAAAGTATVLLLGESGTGKELFARAIHYHSPRSKGPFVAVNCAALPEDLLESELFGYEEGAFTGARRGGKPGKFELAAGGTLFLDEVADCSLRLQAKLLRALDRGEIQRIGSTRTITVDVRVVAATNKDLEALVEQGEFREDLYYRLAVIPIHIPPLRERKGDIPILLDFFMARHARALNRPVPELSPRTREILYRYAWPGNVRELENVVQYILHACEGSIAEPSHLPPRVLGTHKKHPAILSPCEDHHLTLMPITQWEREAIAEGLRRYGNTKRGKELLARQLGMSRSTIYRKIKQFGLDREGRPR